MRLPPGDHAAQSFRGRRISAFPITWHLGDEALVIDPSDSEVAGADNFGEWFGVDHDGARQLRGTLRGDGLTKTP